MARDIFLFCCYTGLAYIDVHNLRPENITEDAHGRKWIRKQREKTDVEFYVPLLEYPLQILENISKMLGHTSTRMTQHYAHVMNDSLAREMDRIAPLVDCVPKKSHFLQTSAKTLLFLK